MKAILLALTLSACAEARQPNLGDAIHEVAVSTCSRYIRCGWSGLRFDQCVDGIEEYYCGKFDCESEYSKLGELLECTEWYTDLDCSVTAHFCVPVIP